MMLASSHFLTERRLFMTHWCKIVYLCHIIAFYSGSMYCQCQNVKSQLFALFTTLNSYGGKSQAQPNAKERYFDLTDLLLTPPLFLSNCKLIVKLTGLVHSYFKWRRVEVHFVPKLDSYLEFFIGANFIFIFLTPLNISL